jgi:peptide subunit release factor RF-3
MLARNWKKPVGSSSALINFGMRLSRPYKLFANKRKIVDEAFAGDVLGIPNNGDFTIGDTMCADPALSA